MQEQTIQIRDFEGLGRMPVRRSTRQILAWHGWQLSIPRTWDPVQIDGDYDRGQLLLADLRRQKLRLRWQTFVKSVFDPRDSVVRAMCEEIGEADAAKQIVIRTTIDGMVGAQFESPTIPGRDVFTAYDESRRRMIQISYNAQHRDHALQNVLIPSLRTARSRWSIFGLSCDVPAEYRLVSKSLAAGDVSLTFHAGDHRLTIRQISLASVALRNRSLSQWIADQQRGSRVHYVAENTRVVSDVEAIAMSHRKRRFFFMRSWPSETVTIARVDALMDRLLMVESDEESTARATLESALRGEE